MPLQPTPLHARPSTIHWRVPSDPCTTRGPLSWNFVGRRFVHKSKGRCISRQCPSADMTPNLFSIVRFPSLLVDGSNPLRPLLDRSGKAGADRGEEKLVRPVDDVIERRG